MEVDFTRLRYFVAVAEELHFKRAADRLMITPPPLSKQIKLLEKELGGPLFERHYHDVRLTPLGTQLLGPARDILRQVDEFKATASRITNGAGPVRFGATAYAPSDFLAELEKVVAALPEPTEFSVPGSAAEVTAKLVSGHLDIGLIHLPAPDKRLRHRVVARYQGAIAVRFDDPLAVNDIVTVEALRERDVVIDFARPNPVVLAGLTRRLNARGVTRIVRTTNQLGGELEDGHAGLQPPARRDRQLCPRVGHRQNLLPTGVQTHSHRRKYLGSGGNRIGVDARPVTAGARDRSAGRADRRRTRGGAP